MAMILFFVSNENLEGAVSFSKTHSDFHFVFSIFDIEAIIEQAAVNFENYNKNIIGR